MNSFLEDSVRPKFVGLPFQPVPAASFSEAQARRNLDPPLSLPVKPVPSELADADFVNPFRQEGHRSVEPSLPKPISVRGPDNSETRKSEAVSMFDEAVHLNALLEESSLKLRQNLPEMEPQRPWPSFLASGVGREPSPERLMPVPSRKFDFEEGSMFHGPFEERPVRSYDEPLPVSSHPPAKQGRWDLARDETQGDQTGIAKQAHDLITTSSQPPSSVAAAQAPASAKLSLKAAAASFMAQRQQPSTAATPVMTSSAASDWQKETDEFLAKLGVGSAKPTADKVRERSPSSSGKKSATGVAGNCICCASKDHSAGRCTTFSCLPLEERWTLVRQSPCCCTHCLVVDHDFESCPTRKSNHPLTCCDRYHDLLHKCALKVPAAILSHFG